MNAASRSHRVHLRAVSQALQDEAFPAGNTSTVRLHWSRYEWTAKHVQRAPYPFRLPGSFVSVCPVTSVNSKSDILRTDALNTTARLDNLTATNLSARACRVWLARSPKSRCCRFSQLRGLNAHLGNTPHFCCCRRTRCTVFSDTTPAKCPRTYEQ